MAAAPDDLIPKFNEVMNLVSSTTETGVNDSKSASNEESSAIDSVHGVDDKTVTKIRISKDDVKSENGNWD